MTSEAAKKIRNTLIREVLDTTPIALKRERWEETTRALVTPSGVTAHKVLVDGVPCLKCTPVHLESDDVVVYCHGGGLVEGSAETFRIWTSRLALHMGCRVISVDYRLAPEHPYPAAVRDVISVCRSLTSNPNYYGAISIGGDSSGCILALAALRYLRPLHLYNVRSGFLLSPSIDLTFSGDSIEKNASLDPVVSLPVLKHYAGLYAGGKELSDPEISPLFADLKELPPLLVMVDDNEILLDDTIRLVKKINSSDGVAKLGQVNGLWHVWPTWGEFPESTAALSRIRQHILNTDLASR